MPLAEKLTFNTQKSTQWDGLRHFAYQKEKLFYNRRTREDILTSSEGSLGIHWWHKVGGIAARGVLLDYWSYAEANDKCYDPTGPYAIPFEELIECLQWQQGLSVSVGEELEFRAGDILLIRTGYMTKYNDMSQEEERVAGKADPPASCGVKQGRGLLAWLWEGRFAAVGGDAPGWEAFPGDESAGFLFHEVLIAGWGCPIAELLWLEDLAEWCRERKRWTFFLSSCPLNVYGGVASPANMMALV